jgi:glycerol-3-phosphate dehydrogenase
MIQTRQERIARLKTDPNVSVLIVGAGINGIGTFRDLALQGVDVLIIDKEDYCSGTSAASSHMVHGGIRYLENGEIRLVREAVRERNRLIRNAPHLVKPLPTTFPIFKWSSGLLNAPFKLLGILNKPAERGALVIKIGMAFYDLLAGRSNTVPPHFFRSRKSSLEVFPSINPEILFTATYYDGSMESPERIAIELIADACAASEQAVALNYVSLAGLDGEAVFLEDRLSGDELIVRPRVVVNACGPWIDKSNQLLEFTSDYIGGTKGSHVVLHHPELRSAIRDNEFFFENSDGRIVLIFPLRDRVLVGTSDIRTNDPNPNGISEEEVDYFLSMIQRVFPRITVDRSHIIFSFSGVRPLANSKRERAGMISRDHRVEVDSPKSGRSFPVVSLVGGKWTTFRALSEQAADIVLERLALERKLSTEGVGIGGGKGFPTTPSERNQVFSSVAQGREISEPHFAELFSRYGMNALKMLETQENFDIPLRSNRGMTIGEIEHVLEHEDVVHLDDLILRRTSIAKLGNATHEGLAELAEISAKQLGWDQKRTADELKRVVEILKSKHRIHEGQYLPAYSSEAFSTIA